ncbi:MAG TPA: AAA family ATPase [Tepidisphaeraceae bacterium]
MPEKPRCIIVTGRPGAGKSTLSKELAKLLYMPAISRDEIKEGFVNTLGVCHDELPPDSNKLATEIFFETVSFLLARKISLIAEAAFQHHVWQSRMDSLCTSARVCLVICSVGPDIAARRRLQRGLNDPRREFYHGDERVAIFRERGIPEPPSDYESPAFDLPTIEVSTLDGYSPALDQVRDFAIASTD